ncbi:MAG: DNA polymerase III subunit delta', partial [Pseudomonadota bacterium]
MIQGHDRPIDRFLGAWRSGAMHHAWLLTGPRGLGKAMFAEAAALRILAEAAGPKPEG